MNTPRETAILVVLIIVRAGQTRARISNKTIKTLGRRRRLRAAFITALADEMAELGWSLIELVEGFAAIRSSTLEAAKVVTQRRQLSDEERRSLRRGTLDFAALLHEVAGETETLDEDDEGDDER